MRPFDLLTIEDKELIRQWGINYASTEPQSIEQILSTWDKNKRLLFRLFGKRLRISFPIHEKINSSYRTSKWRMLYSPLIVYTEGDLRTFKADPRNHRFINSLGEWLRDTQIGKIDFHNIKDILEYTKYCYVEWGKTGAEKVFTNVFKDKILKIPSNTRIMRAVRKVLEYYDYPDMQAFNQWRDDISVINTDREIDGELVFSIHPVDFITMSDNKCGWTSCMSWIDHGAYSTGTLEMMNSNVAVVVYLQSPQSFIYNDLTIPNKTWRTLVFIHKDILLVGKHYPYQSEALAKIVLNKMQEIVKDSLGWKYRYKNQLYLDMMRSYDNNYIRENFGRLTTGHKIYTYTNMMYHDIVEDHCTDYWCCRNRVDKNLYLNLSGPATCMCCGKKLENTSDFYSRKYCDDCKKFQCGGCGLVSVEHSKHFIHFKEIYHYYCHKIIYNQGHPDCILDHFYWDRKDKALFPKSKVWSRFSPREKKERFVPLTREKVLQIEICNQLSDEFKELYDFC